MKINHFTMALVSAWLLLTAVPSHAKAVTSNEHQAVVDTALRYFNGVASGDQAILAKAFDMEYGDIKMLRVDDETGKETIKTLPLSEFAKIFKQATKDTWEAEVLSVDIVKNKMAMVKLNFDTPKTNYIDYLVLHKRNGQWRIVNKTFVAEKKAE